MIWLTWRQFRAQAGVAFAALAAVALTLAVTGPHLVHLYDASGISTCQAHRDCGTLTSEFLSQFNQSHYHSLQLLGTALVVVPGIIGIFWGAPLVARELETGTFRLAWTQSVTRTRWLGVKLGVIGLASMAVAGAFSLMVTWWSSPIDRVTLNRLTSGFFGERGIVPIGYAAFAFALGVTAGVLIRRTLPAMATTLVAFVAARMVVTYGVRPHLIAPVVHLSSVPRFASGGSLVFTGPAGGQLMAPAHIPAGAWVYSSRVADAAGHAITPAFLKAACGSPSSGRVSYQACIDKLRIREVLTYQPASRFWSLQWYETAIFLALALILAGLCFWWVRRRLS